jgi:hypothetical protein
MMDEAIRPVTPEIMRQRGADAFDRHEGIDDHNMNPHTSAVAIADWQKGWRERQAVVYARVAVKPMLELAGANPP